MFVHTYENGSRLAECCGSYAYSKFDYFLNANPGIAVFACKAGDLEHYQSRIPVAPEQYNIRVVTLGKYNRLIMKERVCV